MSTAYLAFPQTPFMHYKTKYYTKKMKNYREWTREGRGKSKTREIR
jgi:hypothetical protein